MLNISANLPCLRVLRLISSCGASSRFQCFPILKLFCTHIAWAALMSYSPFRAIDVTKCKIYNSGDGEELLRELTNTLKHKYHQDAFIVPISALVLQRGWGGAGGQSGQCQANLPQDGGRNQPGHCSIFILLRVLKIIFSRMWNQSWRARSRWQAWAPGSSPTQSLLRSMLLQIWTVSAF